jgi:hypothetical protein
VAGEIGGAPGGGTVGGGEEGEELACCTGVQRGGVSRLETAESRAAIAVAASPRRFLRTGRRLSPIQDAALPSKLWGPRGNPKNGGTVRSGLFLEQNPVNYRCMTFC